ncbi:hypothetical protein CYMTET_14337 [Cymbomonas tetramitiformis]|uniref:Uncharacterized protein n=1 Tax=Cymbomonas tetramitiformis TaxID=36881 RepID=A0AAE0LAG7_9CHLO|nr:hypothetical protein CYMTET_14337 [Cymbomonas tetramitiformis]
MSSTGQRSLGDALRSARATSASGTPSHSVNSGSRAATPRQGLRTPGPTGPDPVKGYTFDGPDAETDFAILLSNLHHVLSPVSHFEYDKIFDLEHEYLEYHWALNELVFIILKGVLQGSALALYQESARMHPRGDAAFHTMQSRLNIVKPVGDWKPPPRHGRYLVWEGTGYPCISCFRLWGITDGHLSTKGVCPFSCTATFAPGQAPAAAPAAPPRPTIAAWSQPAGTAAPAAAAVPRQPAGSPSLQFAAVVDDAVEEEGSPAAFTFRPHVDRGDDDNWPALRTVYRGSRPFRGRPPTPSSH